MSSQSITYYEEHFKENIMKFLAGERIVSLKQMLEELICERPEDHKVINFAYINVKNELTGFNSTSRNEEEL